MSARNTVRGLLALAALAAAGAPAQAEVLELKAHVYHDLDDRYPPSIGSYLTVRVSLSKQVPYYIIDPPTRTYLFDEVADGLVITVTFDGEPRETLTFTSGYITTPTNPQGDDHVVIVAPGSPGLFIDLGTSTLDPAAEHPFPLAIHDFEGGLISMMDSSGGLLDFKAQVERAVPIREELQLLGQAKQGIEGLASTLTNKSSQASVDALATSMETKASQASLDQLASELAGLQTKADNVRSGVVQVLANQESSLALLKADIAALRTGLDQVLANQATVVSSMVDAHEKLDRLLKNK